MKPLKLPYRVALAGALAAGAAGLGAGALASLTGRKHRQRPLPAWFLPLSAVGSAAAFSILYYLPLSRRRNNGPVVYLTFDDGPDPEATPRILDALASHSGRATFFMLGESVTDYPEIVRRIAGEGHAIGIHGFHHRAVTFLTPGQIGEELDRTLRAIRAAGVQTPVRLYRPPYLLRGPGLGMALRARGLRLVLLTLDSQDYLMRQPEPIQQRLARLLKNGDMVVLHDEGETGRATARALPAILQEMARRGIRTEALDRANASS